MPGIFSAGIAEHIRAGFAVYIAEIFFIEKGASSVILTEGLFLPVNIIMQAVAKNPPVFAVFFQAFVVNHNLPSRTAGVRTGSCNTGKFFIVIWKCKLHGITLLPFVFS